MSDTPPPQKKWLFLHNRHLVKVVIVAAILAAGLIVFFEIRLATKPRSMDEIGRSMVDELVRQPRPRSLGMDPLTEEQIRAHERKKSRPP